MNRFKRGDGVEHADERRMGFGVFLDHLLPIVAVALLGWLCIGQVTLQGQVAVLLERTTAQNGRAEQQAQALNALRGSDEALQKQILELKEARR